MAPSVSSPISEIATAITQSAASCSTKKTLMWTLAKASAFDTGRTAAQQSQVGTEYFEIHSGDSPRSSTSGGSMRRLEFQVELILAGLTLVMDQLNIKHDMGLANTVETSPSQSMPFLSCNQGVQTDYHQTIFTDADRLEYDAIIAAKGSQGCWETLEDASHVKVGDIVKLCSAIESINPAIDLHHGLCGYVRKVDEDGDVMAYFPEVFQHKAGEHWVRTSSRKTCNSLQRLASSAGSPRVPARHRTASGHAVSGPDGAAGSWESSREYENCA